MEPAREAHDPAVSASAQSHWSRAFGELPANVVPLRPRLRDRMRAQWPSLSVQALGAASVVLMAFDHFRRGTTLLAIALGWALFLRQTLPPRHVGWLQVRSKRTDLLVLGALFVGVVALAVTTPTA